MRSATRCSSRNRRTHGPSRLSSFMVGPHCVLSKTLAGRLQEVGGHLQISLGRSNIDVAKVGRELREQSLHVLAGAMPRDHPMHGGRVANVVQPGGSRFAGRATDSCGSANMLKPRDDASVVPRSPSMGASCPRSSECCPGSIGTPVRHHRNPQFRPPTSAPAGPTHPAPAGRWSSRRKREKRVAPSVSAIQLLVSNHRKLLRSKPRYAWVN